MAEEKNFNALLERICKDGVDKANKEKDEILSTAKKEAEDIVSKAKEEAQRIVSEAEKKAKDFESNAKSEVARGGEQAISVIKQRIKDLVTASVLDEGLKGAFADTAFLKDLILEVVKKWDIASGNSDVTVYFPESKKADIDAAFEKSIKSAINNATINFDKKLSNGFKIVPNNGNYQLQFTDEDFVEFFSDYIKAKTEEVIFSK